MSIMFVLYLIAFLGIFFNSYTLPNLNNDSRIIFLIIIGLLILDRLTFTITENFITDTTSTKTNTIFNTGTFTANNINATGTITVTKNMNVKGKANLTDFVTFGNGAIMKVKGGEGPGFMIKGPNGSYINYYEHGGNRMDYDVFNK